MDGEIVVVVADADTTSSETVALGKAARDVLAGRAVRVVGATRDAVPSTGAVVIVEWDAEGRHAHLKARSSADAPWIERDLGFDARDAPAERGRAVGLSIASLLPEPPTPATPAAPATPPAPPSATPEARVRPQPPRLDPPARPRSVELALHGHASVALGGEGGGLGGAVDGQYFFGRYVGLRAVLGGRFADAPYAEGVASHLHAGIGVAVRYPLHRGLELGVGATVLVVRDGLRHLSPDFDEPAPVFDARYLPGAQGIIRLSWFVTESAALELGLGAEVAFGVTDVYLNGGVAGTFVPVRGLVEPGIRIRF